LSAIKRRETLTTTTLVFRESHPKSEEIERH